MTPREKVLADCGASGSVMQELLAYNENPYRAHDAPPRALPLPDEEHLDAWTGYEREAAERGAFEVLRERLVQLRFPIRAGISGEESYRRATRKGDYSAARADAPGLELQQPGDVGLTLCPTIAGRIPVITASHRADFVALVRACTGRNEPVAVPPSMGACLVVGFNNWDRIAAYRRRWEEKQPGAVSEAAWNEEFRRLVPRKDLYQDRFIIVSRGPYSAVGAADTGFTEAAWLEHSLQIRRAHEFTHYFTYRIFGLIRSNALDELVADFNGLVQAFGVFRTDLALRFLGLERFPRFRPDGRLSGYRGDTPLSDPAFEVLRSLVHRSVINLARLGEQRADLLHSLEGLAGLTHTLIRLTLEELASEDMAERVEEGLL